jgi:hypothetical protein
VRQAFQEYIKSLLRLILPNFYKEKTDGPTKIIIAGAVFFSAGPIAIILLSRNLPNSLIWQILVVIFTITSSLFVTYTILTVTSIVSQLKGAELALQNPPPRGETWIQLTDGEEIIWKGKEFTQPANKEGEKQPFAIVIREVYVPRQYERWRNWQRVYNDEKLQEMYQGEGVYKGLKRSDIWQKIRDYVGDVHREPTKVDTLKELFYAGDRGYLIDYERDMQRLSRKNPE